MNETLCNICSESDPSKKKVKLECSHVFCIECMQKYIKVKIQAHHVSPNSLVCPEENCKSSLNYFRVKEIISNADFEKYDELLNNGAILADGDRFFDCPNCNSKLVIPKKEEVSFIKCWNCQKRWCTNEDCMGDWDEHGGKLCAEYKKGDFKGKMNEELFQEYAKNNGLMPCPTCGAQIDKTKNCNFVRCESPKCQKKTIFCYLCGQLLKEKEIPAHFKNENEFNGCVNKNLPKEEKKEKEEEQSKIPEKEKVEANIINSAIEHDRAEEGVKFNNFIKEEKNSKKENLPNNEEEEKEIKNNNDSIDEKKDLGMSDKKESNIDVKPIQEQNKKDFTREIPSPETRLIINIGNLTDVNLNTNNNDLDRKKNMTTKDNSMFISPPMPMINNISIKNNDNNNKEDDDNGFWCNWCCFKSPKNKHTTQHGKNSNSSTNLISNSPPITYNE